MKKSIIFAASAMFALSGCTKDAIEPITPNTLSSELATISASTAPQEDETRTSLSNGNILWTEGDQIALRLAADYKKSATYTLKTGTGTAKGTFEGEALPEGPKYALYPMSIYDGYQYNTKLILLTLPTTQPYKAGSFGNGANPMVAKSDAAGENLAFQNLCGAIRLKLTGTATVKQITVTSAVEPIAGYSEFNMTYTDDPHIQLSSTVTTVLLSNINETLDPATPKEFTIILPPGAYAAGMYFTIETSDGLFMNKVTTAPITVTRSKVLPLAAFEVVAKAYNFPDKNFRKGLKEQGCVLSNEGTADEDIDINNETNKEKFNSMTDIDCGSSVITSLKGIEYFTALTVLYCADNLLVSLDLTHNTALTNLSCSDNQLTSLDLSENTALTRLQCGGTLLTSLDLSANTALTQIYCENNKLTSLDLSANTALTHLNCGNNLLTSLNLTKNTALTNLQCDNNQFTSLNLSANTALNWLNCYNNQLSMLDLTHNTTDIRNYSFQIGAQVAADGTLLDMTAYVSENQTSELDTNDENNARATLVKGNPPTPAPAMR